MPRGRTLPHCVSLTAVCSPAAGPAAVPSVATRQGGDSGRAGDVLEPNSPAAIEPTPRAWHLPRAPESRHAGEPSWLDLDHRQVGKLGASRGAVRSSAISSLATVTPRSTLPGNVHERSRFGLEARRSVGPQWRSGSRILAAYHRLSGEELARVTKIMRLTANVVPLVLLGNRPLAPDPPPCPPPQGGRGMSAPSAAKMRKGIARLCRRFPP